MKESQDCPRSSLSCFVLSCPSSHFCRVCLVSFCHLRVYSGVLTGSLKVTWDTLILQNQSTLLTVFAKSVTFVGCVTFMLCLVFYVFCLFCVILLPYFIFSPKISKWRKMWQTDRQTKKDIELRGPLKYISAIKLKSIHLYVCIYVWMLYNINWFVRWMKTI